MIVLVLASEIVHNLPNSALKRDIGPSLQSIGSGAGLDQVWSMYAPDPISAREFVEVRVQLAGGTDRVWTWHRDGLLAGPFRWYHWQKLKEQLIRDPAARRGVTLWAVRQLTRAGDRPLRVQMIMRTEQLPAPGTDERGAVDVKTIYDETLGPR